MEIVVRQFHQPSGLLGELAGWLLARRNAERNLWAVSLLDIAPDQHVLEIGFGPGLAIQEAARYAVNGLVAGIDPSDVMLRQAQRRNIAGVRSGKIDLRPGDAMALPFDNASFDKVLAVNSYHIWPDRRRGLSEVLRVLRPDGRLVIVEQPVGGKPEAQAEHLRVELQAQLAEAGFRDTYLQETNIRQRPIVAVTGTK
jgi:ubiquinone/menaquinone biosynthesis C-methylase UbiE